MSYTKLYIGAETPLMAYKGDDIIGFTFTVTNSDDSAYDFTGYTDINLTIYNHRGGDVLATLVATTNLTISSNVITLNADYSTDINISDLSIHYYELTYLDASSRPITVCFGDFKII
jgi:hypothetical protein